jgi:hypothetical protein
MLLHLQPLLCVPSLIPFQRRPIHHNVQSLIFRSLMKVPTICFATSSSTVFLKILLSAVPLPWHGSCHLLCTLMPLPVVLSFLRGSCYLEPWFLIPVMPSGFAQFSSCTSIFSSFPLPHYPWSIFSVISVWPSVLYKRVPYATQGTPLHAATNFFWDPPSPWVHFFIWPRRLIARCLSPCHFTSALTVFIVASSLGTS